jgi:hypothetical protein
VSHSLHCVVLGSKPYQNCLTISSTVTTLSRAVLPHNVQELCAVGTYSSDGAACVPCPPGRYSDRPGADICRPCPSDSPYSPSGTTSREGCASCDQGCDDGTFGAAWTGSSCPAGLSCNVTTQVTVRCMSLWICACTSPSITDCPHAIHVQMVCGAGQYSPPEVNVCLSCPMGRYSGPKSAACTPCMFWAPFSFQGSTHLDNCTCPAGYACFAESPPEKCPEGTFSVAGDTACTPCPEFTDSPAGADKCLSPCPGVQELSGGYVTGLCVDACNPGAVRS